MLLSWINSIVQDIFIRNFEPYTWRPLKTEILTTLYAHGEGLYLVNIKSAPKDFISKIIGLFSSGYSHTVIAAYYNQQTLMYTDKDLKNVRDSLNFFYGNTILDFSKIKAIVLSSANQEGIVCCDLSKYNNRAMTIRKMPLTLPEQRACIEYLCYHINKPYDATGLVGWIFKKWDDPDNHYCSELCHDAVKNSAEGFRIASIDNPSPGDIEIYAAMNNWENLYKNN